MPDDPTATAACEHYWFVMPDDAPLDVDSLVKQVCGKPATGRTEWLGSHGKPDREIAVCDSCRESVWVQNIFQQAERETTTTAAPCGHGWGDCCCPDCCEYAASLTTDEPVRRETVTVPLDRHTR